MQFHIILDHFLHISEEKVEKGKVDDRLQRP